MTKRLRLILLLVLFLLLPPRVIGVELSVSNVPSTIDQSQEFEVDVDLSCSGCGDSYLRGVFYPSGNSYFGYTQDNGGDWSNASASSCQNFFKIGKTDLKQGSWSGRLRFKPDVESSYYSGPKRYFFKIGRYTPSCSLSVWSSENIMAISGPTPTPIPTETPIPTNTLVPTEIPTSIKMPTSDASKPTPVISNSKKAPTPIRNPILGGDQQLVLGERDLGEYEGSSDAVLSQESSVEKIEESGGSFIPEILIGIGIVLLTACGILFGRSYIKDRKKDDFPS